MTAILLSMKTVAIILVVALLAWIGYNVQQHESRDAEAQHEHAREAAAFLDCRAHAKDPDLCMEPVQ